MVTEYWYRVIKICFVFLEKRTYLLNYRKRRTASNHLFRLLIAPGYFLFQMFSENARSLFQLHSCLLLLLAFLVTVFAHYQNWVNYLSRRMTSNLTISCQIRSSPSDDRNMHISVRILKTDHTPVKVKRRLNHQGNKTLTEPNEPPWLEEKYCIIANVGIIIIDAIARSQPKNSAHAGYGLLSYDIPVHWTKLAKMMTYKGKT